MPSGHCKAPVLHGVWAVMVSNWSRVRYRCPAIVGVFKTPLHLHTRCTGTSVPGRPACRGLSICGYTRLSEGYNLGVSIKVATRTASSSPSRRSRACSPARSIRCSPRRTPRYPRDARLAESCREELRLLEQPGRCRLRHAINAATSFSSHSRSPTSAPRNDARRWSSRLTRSMTTMQDLVLAAITSQRAEDGAFTIEPGDCIDGTLPKTSVVKPAKLSRCTRRWFSNGSARFALKSSTAFYKNCAASFRESPGMMSLPVAESLVVPRQNQVREESLMLA